MHSLVTGVTLITIALLCFIRCSFGNLVKGPPSPPLLLERAKLVYADTNNILKIDTACIVAIDTTSTFRIVEYRLSTGEVIFPGSRFVWIFEFKKDESPFDFLLD